MKRLAAVLLAVVVISALSLAQPPSTGPGNERGGFAPPPFPGDTTAAERDSLMNEVLEKIAGKEQMAAESVFKDIQIFKGRPASSIPRAMNYGFGRSLGVSCYHCHAKGDWAKDDKKQKRIAREMFKMVMAINNDYLAKIEGLGDSRSTAAGPAGPGGQAGPGGPGGAGGPGGPGGQDRRPVVNCGTCHRGSIHTNPDFGRMGAGPRSGGGGS